MTPISQTPPFPGGSDRSLPPGWSLRRLHDVATVRTGLTGARSRAPGTVERAQLRCSNIAWDGLDLARVGTTVLTLRQAARYSLRPGDIIVAEASGSVNRIGRAALWNGQIEDCVFHSGVVRVRPVLGVDARYLHHAISFDALRGEFGRRAKGVTTLQHLGASTLGNWHVPLPPPAKQRQIADTLDHLLGRLGTGEAARRAAERALPQLWDSVLNAVVDGTLRVGHPPDGPARTGGVQRLRPIGEVATVSSGLRTPRPGGEGSEHPFLGVGNVAREALRLDDLRTVTVPPHQAATAGLCLIEPGDLLVVRQNGSTDRIGQAAAWTGGPAGTLHQNHLARIRPGGSLLPRYLELVWNAPVTLRPLRARARSTTGNHTIRLADIRAVAIPVPALSVQADLVRAADAWRARVNAATAAVDAAGASVKALRLSILAEALSGQLDLCGPVAETTVMAGSLEDDDRQQEFDFR